MAPAAPTSPQDGTSTKIPTAQDVTTAGGVWAPTSAKRDKLAELNLALEEGQETLDDAATLDQKADLFLADGIALIAKIVDGFADLETPEVKELSEWMVEQQRQGPENVDEAELSVRLSALSEKVSKQLEKFPADRYLKDVRDFLDPSKIAAEDLAKLPPGKAYTLDDVFDKAVLRFRLLLTKSAIDHIQSSWNVLTTVSDGDVDRAAVTGERAEPQAKTVSISKVYKYLFAHTSGTCSNRVDAAWELLDRDEDSCLDEIEMNRVAFLCLASVQSALVLLFQEALDSSSVWPPLSSAVENVASPPETSEPKMGWRQRRKAAKRKRNLVKMFQASCKAHFEDEVEINHRLRCIYAWANKEHQGNKVDSVLVDEGWSGKQRYVEFAPKISLKEFREVQQEHFTHLDRIGTEILKSFRKDLWVQQGKGRQNRELMRDCMAFLTIVSVVDYVILSL